MSGPAVSERVLACGRIWAEENPQAEERKLFENFFSSLSELQKAYYYEYLAEAEKNKGAKEKMLYLTGFRDAIHMI